MIKLFKKMLMGTSLVPLFLVFCILMIVSASVGTSAKGMVNITAVLSTDIGNDAYKNFFLPAIAKTYNEKNVLVDLTWIITPYIFIDDLKSLSTENVESVINLTYKQDENKFVLKTLEDYYAELIKMEKFKSINKEQFLSFIVENSDTNAIYYGNIPKQLYKYKKLNLQLPVKSWGSIYDVGLYNPFGEYTMHYGMDIGVPSGTALYAAMNGTITAKQYDNIGGNQVIISNGDLHVLYAHMSIPSPLSIGDKVKVGDEIGKSGATGNVTGAHLHFQACSVSTSNSFADCVSKQKETFFNPRLLWEFK